MKILVVEDEPASLKLAHLVLSSDGHDVATAEAVEQALVRIDESEPEVVLLDLELPTLNGLALARALKRDKPHIVIIAVTAYPERFSREAAVESGCDAYIVKPINTRKLTAQVAGVLEKLK